jgi:membrane fusion protein (multidrug efflux system)
MKGRKKLLIALGGGIAAFFIIYFAYEQYRYVSTDNAQIEAHAVILSAKVGGYVKTVNVKEGDKVKAGDVLAEIDSRDYENTLSKIKGESLSVQARSRDNERNFKRLRDLFDKGVVSQQQFDAASASYFETKAKTDAVSAQVAQAELELASTKIVAPRDGFIARKSIEIGQLAAPGAALIGFVGSDERWVTANFKETEIQDVKLGATVYVDIDALDGKTYMGKVSAISAATGATFTLLPPDNATGNFTKVVQRVPVKIDLIDLKEDDISYLRAGLSANVKVVKH